MTLKFTPVVVVSKLQVSYMVGTQVTHFDMIEGKLHIKIR